MNIVHLYIAVYPECDEDQWSCDNGQCIPLDKRCDVIPDCVDDSDELDEYCNCKFMTPYFIKML